MKYKINNIDLNFKSFNWLLFYLISFCLISYLGSYNGGLNIIPVGYDFFIIAVICVFSLIISSLLKLKNSDSEIIIKNALNSLESEKISKVA